MPKLVAVVGSTGVQGGSVVRALLADSAYTVTAVTRNSRSESAKALSSKGVRVVEANLDDVASLQAAFVGCHAIFAVTNYFEPFVTVGEDAAIEIETRQGINIAKAAASTSTLEHFIWSTLPNSQRISDGKAIVPHYVAKNKVDDYIKSDSALLQKTTFLWVAVYASNMNYPFYQPFPVSTMENKYIQLQTIPASVPMQLIGDANVNIGLFAKSIMEQPEKTLPGNTVLGATDKLTCGELLSTWALALGKDVEYVQVDSTTYRRMWPKWGEAMDKMHIYWELMRDNCFSGEEIILTKDDLSIAGLVDTATAFGNMRGHDGV